ncbi:hypothetical protein [Kibdelosporangium philippinense]|uniref:hypothetical protein n=1 Tax=Kibdelosporangium philippinense TaxID=211113 RepID=UPI00361DE403
MYRNAGKVVRLSDPPTIVTIGGAVGTPIVTTDGTMWLHRQDVGQICTIAKTPTGSAAAPSVSRLDIPAHDHCGR